MLTTKLLEDRVLDQLPDFWYSGHYFGGTMNTFRTILCLILFLHLFCFHCYANITEDQKNAKKLMELEMYPQAIALWEKVADAKVNDPDVFFQLGICNARLSQFEESEKWFTKAVQSDVDYAYKIANIYAEAASYLEKNNNNLMAILAIEKAKIYDPKIEKEIEKTWEKNDPGNLKMLTYDISSKFVYNTKIGKLFVISGKVKNGYSENRGMITLEGKLFSAGKVQTNQERVYCGNVMSDLELENMEWSEIESRLSNRSGDNRSNVKLEPRKSIPFMVVFSGLPDDLDEFTIEVLESKPM